MGKEQLSRISRLQWAAVFPNTELRSLSDERVFEFFDFITLDDGEMPVELLIEHLEEQREKLNSKERLHLLNGEVIYKNNSGS